jgi:hypothetical protein
VLAPEEVLSRVARRVLAATEHVIRCTFVQRKRRRVRGTTRRLPIFWFSGPKVKSVSHELMSSGFEDCAFSVCSSPRQCLPSTVETGHASKSAGSSSSPGCEIAIAFVTFSRARSMAYLPPKQ